MIDGTARHEMGMVLGASSELGGGPLREDTTAAERIGVWPPGWNAESAIVRAVVVFAHFWVIEGALRKWVVPSAGSVLYFGRDTLFLVWVISALVCLPLSRERRRSFLPVAALAAVMTALLAYSVLSTHVKTQVALIGLHAYAAPFLVAAAALVISPRDRPALLLRILGAIRFWLPVQAALTILQTLSPGHGFWNQTGTDSYVDLVTSDGISRASGTFTAPAGLAAYVSIAFLALLVPTFTDRRGEGLGRVPGARMVQWLSLFAVIALAGARTNLFSAAIIFVSYIVVIFLGGGRGLSRVFGLILGGAVSFFAVSAIFPKVTGAFLDRIVIANTQENTVTRITGSFFSYLSDGTAAGAFGDGLGSHSVAGIAAGSGQVWIESELNRWVFELGVVGVVLAFLRQICAVALLVVALYQVSAHHARVRGLVVLVAFPLFLSQDATSQPSLQGFAALMLGLVVLASTGSRGDGSPAPEPAVSPGVGLLAGHRASRPGQGVSAVVSTLLLPPPARGLTC